MAPTLAKGFVEARCPWRIEYDGSPYHVFSRGNNQQDILCDLHVEFENFVLASDVHVGNRGFQWIWNHGHTHESFDYEIGKTRVVCNPRGYAPIEGNKGFRPDYTLVV